MKFTLQKKWKIVIIIFDIIVLALILFRVIYFKLNANKMVDVTLKYDFPSGLKYEIDANKVIISGNENWNAEAILISRKLVKEKNIDELYNKYISTYNPSELNLYKKKINGYDMVVFDYINENKIIYSFMTNWDGCYTVTVNYNNNFNENSLIEVFNSLMNPIEK